MLEFASFLSQFFASFLGLLDSYLFDFGGFYVSLWDILVGFIVFTLAIAVFWKGARG